MAKLTTRERDKLPGPSEFIWWGSDGVKHSTPVRIFQVPEGVQLRFHDRCVECDSEGIPNRSPATVGA